MQTLDLCGFGALYLDDIFDFYSVTSHLGIISSQMLAKCLHTTVKYFKIKCNMTYHVENK